MIFDSTTFSCIIPATCHHLGGDEWELVAADGSILQEGTTDALMSIGVIFPHGTDIEAEAA